MIYFWGVLAHFKHYRYYFNEALVSPFLFSLLNSIPQTHILIVLCFVYSWAHSVAAPIADPHAQTLHITVKLGTKPQSFRFFSATPQDLSASSLSLYWEKNIFWIVDCFSGEREIWSICTQTRRSASLLSKAQWGRCRSPGWPSLLFTVQSACSG